MEDLNRGNTGLEIGQRIDRYVVVEFLGEGGVAKVYKVRHVHLDSIHALKLLMVNDPQTKRRLIDEGRSQAGLRHPNVVAVTDALLYEGQPCLIIEYVDGPSLYDFLAEYKPNLEEALELFRGILRGVDAAHRHGLVHRDLKPENVLLAQTDRGIVPKVADFGLVKVLSKRVGARNTTGDSLMGTPQYMSPEQIAAPGSVDTRADMFSLGCLLFEIVCGEVAFDAMNSYEAMTRIMQDDYTRPEVVKPDLPKRVILSIDGLLAHKAEDRTPDCTHVMDQLYGGVEKIRSVSDDTQQIARDSVISLGSRAQNLIRKGTTVRPARRVRRPPTTTAEGAERPLTVRAERIWIGIIAFLSSLLGVITGLYVARFAGLIAL